ncbi:MAG: cofactor-independent phosphoglycerate mutase [Thermodesulfobacteriota bacterium]|nr:MAG: cofactor-independent phosphoglycerate mutase [Thermodesulfobacteriota bacterium]
MKHIILIGDGMSDNPIETLGGLTPLDYAATPNLDLLAGTGRFGLFASVPQGYAPGSDVANLSILGYDPAKYYRGRAPLEAASIGVKLGANDTAFRCNLVTLSGGGGPKVMVDYSAGHISTEEAREIISDLDNHLKGRGVRFYPGTAYRHLMVWEDAPEGLYKKLKTTPPHDISDKEISGHLPEGEGAEKLRELIELSWEILSAHPVNRKREAEGKRPATSIWLWGQGVAPELPTLKERFGVDGAIISAVDLMKGIGVYAGLEVINVPGITGYIDTNYKGKVEYALKALKDGKDFICVHVEAPDEAGHQGRLDDKLKAIEDFDSEIVGAMLAGLSGEEFTLLALTDHPTPVELKTHTSDAVPFAQCTSEELKTKRGNAKFSEKEAGETGILVDDCEVFMEEFFGG